MHTRLQARLLVSTLLLAHLAAVAMPCPRPASELRVDARLVAIRVAAQTSGHPVGAEGDHVHALEVDEGTPPCHAATPTLLAVCPCGCSDRPATMRTTTALGYALLPAESADPPAAEHPAPSNAGSRDLDGVHDPVDHVPIASA